MFLAPSSSRAVDPYLQTLLLKVSLSRLSGKHRHPGFIFEDITGAISVAISNFIIFLGYYPKKGSFWLSDLIKPADFLGIKYDAMS